MKNKKMLWFIVIVIFIVSIVIACTIKKTTMNDIYNKPNFKGIVLDVWDGGILVSVDDEEDEIKSSDKISVSFDTKLKDEMSNFQVGDKVKIFYDGTILESYPAQIHTVYKILTTNK